MTYKMITHMLMLSFLVCIPQAHASFFGKKKTPQKVVAATESIQQEKATSDIPHSHNRTNPWRIVQEDIRDTVVQVFAQIAEFDWLQPYRTPNQYGTRGSGFFISEEGYIVTNTHVVDQAVAVWVQIPSMGKRPFKVDIVGIYPDKDMALLTLNEQDRAIIKETIGHVPYLKLGDSDAIYRADEVLALGYPLGQESLKSTNGVVSGRHHFNGCNFIQTDTPINRGNSGGPLINYKGEVIGINTCGYESWAAQNVNYAIPSNELSIVLNDFHEIKVLRRPFLGILSVKTNDHLTEYLGNPHPGGCYVVEVVKNGPVDKVGLQTGDMIYEINSHRLDIYGEMSVPWSEDKISIPDYASRLGTGDEVRLVVYRNGERLDFTVYADYTETSPIRRMHPWHEMCDYEVFGGLVVMPLTLNHVRLMGEQVPGLMRYTLINYQTDPVLLITHVFPNSELAYARAISAGYTIKEVNGKSVKTLEDLRSAIKDSLKTGTFVVTASDQVTCASDNIPVVLPMAIALRDTIELAQMYSYPVSDSTKETIQAYNNAQQPQSVI